MPSRMPLAPGPGNNQPDRAERQRLRALDVNNANTNRYHHEDDLSDEEHAQSDRLSQKSRHSISSQSSSRSRSKSRSTKKPKKTRRELSSDDESLESATGVPDSFRSNKENRRQSSNSEIMANTKNNRRASRRSSRNQNPDPDDDGYTPEESARMAERDKEIEQLRAELTQVKATNTRPIAKIPSRSSGKMTDEEKMWLRSVTDATKKYCWGFIKFCQTEEMLVKLTARVFDKWKLKQFEGLVGEARETAKIHWIAQNKDYVRLAMNDIRNYAQAGLRKFIVERLTSGQWVPTPTEVLDCALRNEEFHTEPANHKIFDMYADHLLFKVVGKDHWDTWMRYYGPISSAKPANDPQADPYISVGTEAFLVACYENCYVKWECIAEQKMAGTKDPARKDPRHKTTMIDTDGGQVRWGGWNKVGRDRVKDVGKLIKAAREQPHVQEMEQACLQRMRAEHDIEERDKKRGARTRKRKVVEVEAEESEDEFNSF